MFDKFLKNKNMTQEQFDALDEEATKALLKEFNKFTADEWKRLEGEIGKTATKEELKAITETVNKFIAELKGVTGEEFKTYRQAIIDQGVAIKGIKDKGKPSELNETIKSQIVAQIAEKSEEFNALKEDRKATFNLTLKAAADMLTSTNLTGRVARTETEAGRVRIVRRRPFVLDYVTVRPTTAKTVYYIEQVSPDGAPAMTAEGAVKAQIDWDYVEREASMKKITAFTKVSKEMLDDVDGFAQDIADEIEERIMLIEDEQVLTGDGTGLNILGIAANATAFAVGGLANTVFAANEMDALRAAVAQVHRNLFFATVAFIHPDKAAEMDLKKATDGVYLLPPFTTADGMVVKGVPVVENTGIGADDFYVGEMSKYIYKRREEFNISIGYDGNDWTKNMLTPLGELRGAGYIPQNHFGAIVKGTFTVAKALLDPAVADS